MSDLPAKDPDGTCNGRKTDGSGYCKQPEGWGTDHTGIGRCKFHAGSSPGYEAKILDELEEAGREGTIALRLRIKQLRQRLENDEEIDGKELDRLLRTALDRIGHGPTEKREHDLPEELTHKVFDVDTSNLPDPPEDEDGDSD